MFLGFERPYCNLGSVVETANLFEPKRLLRMLLQAFYIQNIFKVYVLSWKHIADLKEWIRHSEWIELDHGANAEDHWHSLGQLLLLLALAPTCKRHHAV